MSDRNAYSQHNVLYPTPPWNNSNPQYTPSYYPPSYNPANNPQSATPAPPYGTANPPSPNIAYQCTQYAMGTPYVPLSNPPSVPPPSSYNSLNQGMPPSPTSRQTHSHAHSRSRSHSQSHHPYLPQQPSMHSPTPNSPSQYPQVAFPQPINIPPQYPASPTRPFSCDLCPLSFNRQHDLKRHRDTHTGEKPFLCNGGCGKTFTRKDALKRHQLVKQCGHDEES